MTEPRLEAEFHGQRVPLRMDTEAERLRFCGDNGASYDATVLVVFPRGGFVQAMGLKKQLRKWGYKDVQLERIP